MNVLDKSKDFWLATGLSLLAALVFYFTTKPTMEHFDYTVRIALALLRGHLGLDRHPGSWLIIQSFPWAQFLASFRLRFSSKQGGFTGSPRIS